MLEVTFVYKGEEEKIVCQQNISLKEVIKQFINKVNIQDKQVIYLFNGEKIRDGNKIIENMTKDKSITILVYDVENNIIQSKEIICPKCQCSSLLTIKDYN